VDGVGDSEAGGDMLERISNAVDTVVRHMAGFLLAVMTLVVFLQVLFRYVFDAPLDWSEELATFTFAWMTLLGAGIGLKYDQHPSLDIFQSRFPPPLRKAAQVLVNLAVMFMLVVLCIYGWKLTTAMKMEKMAALGYSVAFIYIILPVSSVIMFIHILVRTIVLIAPGKGKD
jgi:TRAP-type C4-dicarboxylate transport system permease small subunit